MLDQRIFNKNLNKIFKIDKVKIFARTVLNFGIFSEEFLNNKKKLNSIKTTIDIIGILIKLIYG